MISFFTKHERQINIILPVIVTICIFYSGNLGQRISEIYTSYTIDAITINNSFITLDINASTNNNESFKETKNNLSEQMRQFNDKYNKGIVEAELKDVIKWWVDKIIYLLIFFMIIFNIFIPTKKLD